MNFRSKKNRFFTALSPWILIGAIGVLLPVVAFLTIENINRQKESSVQLLVEKGAALIRSFEIGTRMGMRGPSWSRMQLQNLVSETVRQPDIVYISVVGVQGRVLAHNDPDRIGSLYEKNLNLREVAESDNLNWRIVTAGTGKKIFEVFRKFSPSHSGLCMYPSQQKSRQWCQTPGRSLRSIDQSSRIIFIGLDMAPIDAARQADTRHTIVMGLILLSIGFGGVVFLFLAQGYRTARASLTRIKAFSDTLVEYMPIGLVVLDSRGCVASFNQVAESILGLDPADSVGTDAAQSLPDDFMQLMNQLDAGGGVIEREIECRIRDDRTVPLSISASVLKDENESFPGYVFLFKDLSEVRTLREEIVRNQRLATVGRLAAGVAHEIRNPLSSIKGFAVYFKERYDRPEDRKVADIMAGEVDRLNRVVGQLLEFSRPVTISRRNTDMQPFIEKTVKLVEARAAEARVDIRVEPPSGPLTVRMDPDRMNQVLLNLYLNGIEAMPDGGILRVSTSEEPGKNTVLISVKDSGCGISKEDLDHVFDPYFTNKASGTGLGLAIAHNIVEAHGGEIKVNSRVGEGTRVVVRLPMG